MTDGMDDNRVIDQAWLEAEGWGRDAAQANRWGRAGVEIVADGPRQFCWYDAHGIPTVLLLTRGDLRILLLSVLGM